MSGPGKPRASVPGMDDYDPERRDEEAAEEAAGEVMAAIEIMRSSGSYDWADDTLRGIYDTVAEKRRVTERQRRALRNILESRPEAMEGLNLELAFQ